MSQISTPTGSPHAAAGLGDISCHPPHPDTAAGGTLCSPDAARWQDSLRDFYARVRGRTRTRRRHYYYGRICKRLANIVEPGRRVLDIGCGTGDLLASLKPSVGVGVDLHDESVCEARKLYPDLRFINMPGENVSQLSDTFDYVVLSQTVGEIYDLQELFRAIRSVCHARTRLIVVHYSRLWQPVLKVLEWLRLKRPSPEQNWVPSDEINHLLKLSNFDTVQMVGMTVCPMYVPLLSTFLNRFVANLPGMSHLGLSHIVVARCVDPVVLRKHEPKSVSIVVPARNESGHIRQLLERIPRMTDQQEVIFVEGHSTDDTWDEIRRVADSYDGPFTIKVMRQEGKGKGDAVRKGFAAASGDVLMILDADISVPPEELPMFFDTLASGRGEFINGSRMVYLMDKRAMRFLNLLGNKAFGLVFTYLLSQRFRDTLCGTKVLLRTDYERIAANRSYFGDFDPFGDFDLLFGAARASLKIVDVPVHYKARTYGETNISRFRHGLILLRMCLFAARKIKFV